LKIEFSESRYGEIVGHAHLGKACAFLLDHVAGKRFALFGVFCDDIAYAAVSCEFFLGSTQIIAFFGAEGVGGGLGWIETKGIRSIMKSLKNLCW